MRDHVRAASRLIDACLRIFLIFAVYRLQRYAASAAKIADVLLMPRHARARAAEQMQHVDANDYTPDDA